MGWCSILQKYEIPSAAIPAPSTDPDAIVVDIDCTKSFKLKKRPAIASHQGGESSFHQDIYDQWPTFGCSSMAD